VSSDTPPPLLSDLFMLGVLVRPGSARLLTGRCIHRKSLPFSLEVCRRFRVRQTVFESFRRHPCPFPSAAHHIFSPTAYFALNLSGSEHRAILENFPYLLFCPRATSKPFHAGIPSLCQEKTVFSSPPPFGLTSEKGPEIVFN